MHLIQNNKRNRIKFSILVFSLIMVVIMLGMAGCFPSQDRGGNESGKPAVTIGNLNDQDIIQKPFDDETNGLLKVHYIDVGQADSILIQTNHGTMLVDAGNNADAKRVVDYIKKQGINKLDIVIGTHPHEDHIGGLDTVINVFDVGKVYMPKVMHTTKTFKDVITAIKNKNLTITTPVAGSNFNLGDIKCTIFAPNDNEYEDLNNHSIVIKAEYGETSYLFTGDAEDISENEMLQKGFNLKADVLKLGHHGSHSSSTGRFLTAVDPSYAVISVGADNDYGHPHQETVQKLKSKGIQVYRTDECGTIVFISDGKNISFHTEK